MIETRFTQALADRSLHLILALLSALALLVSLASCTSGAAADGPRLSFHEQSHDFGQISASEKTEYSFPFTNIGSRPLEINDIRRESPSPGG